jgi:hypothetical protein
MTSLRFGLLSAITMAREADMKPIAAACRVYDPEAIKAMGWAFDNTVKHLPTQSWRLKQMREDLSRCILQLYDSGENDPVRLANRALVECFPTSFPIRAIATKYACDPIALIEEHFAKG